jgi:hypothetical protein
MKKGSLFDRMVGVGANLIFKGGGTPMKYVGIGYHKKYSHVRP